MRRLNAIALGAIALALTAPGAVRSASAQCATGCSSSAACNATGRGSCFVYCDGGLCNCTDTDCTTEVLPPAGDARVPAASAPVFVSLRIEGGADVLRGRRLHPRLLVDCRGNVLDVRLLDARGREGFEELERIGLQPPRTGPPPRLAARR